MSDVFKTYAEMMLMAGCSQTTRDVGLPVCVFPVGISWLSQFLLAQCELAYTAEGIASQGCSSLAELWLLVL